MSQFNSIAPNLSISNSPGWGNYNQPVVHGLLKDVDIILSKAINHEPFTSCATMIEHWNGDPMCIRTSTGNMILLSTRNNFWGQWVFQFAHEYCHHLMNESLSGIISGLIWFEEVICHMSSIYNLQVITNQWKNSHDPLKRCSFHVFRDHPDAHILEHSPLYHSLDRPGWLMDHLMILSEPQYHRDLYVAIAEKILPLFLENPSLWKIILHIGDSSQWNSLQDLFDHLFEKAEPDYIESLHDLHNLLFC